MKRLVASCALVVAVAAGCLGVSADAAFPAAGSAAHQPPHLPGVAKIQLRTPTTGAGARPIFAWKPVSGAVLYSLFVARSNGDVYWAWQGTTTKVALGGGTEPLPLRAAGPVLAKNMSWYVIAVDANNAIIAQSTTQRISP